MKIGDRVRIKSYDDISWRKNTGLGGCFYTDELLFDPTMEQYCGDTITVSHIKVKSYGTIYKSKENFWWWHENWVIISDFLSDKDFEI